jgi:hypothetical protein
VPTGVFENLDVALSRAGSDQAREGDVHTLRFEEVLQRAFPRLQQNDRRVLRDPMLQQARVQLARLLDSHIHVRVEQQGPRFKAVRVLTDDIPSQTHPAAFPTHHVRLRVFGRLNFDLCHTYQYSITVLIFT